MVGLSMRVILISVSTPLLWLACRSGPLSPPLDDAGVTMTGGSGVIPLELVWEV